MLPLSYRTSQKRYPLLAVFVSLKFRAAIQYLWSPTGIARGTLLHAPAGRHPGQTLAHSSTGKARGLLLPG